MVVDLLTVSKATSVLASRSRNPKETQDEERKNEERNEEMRGLRVLVLLKRRRVQTNVCQFPCHSYNPCKAPEQKHVVRTRLEYCTSQIFFVINT